MQVTVMDIVLLITCAVIMILVKKYQLWLKLSVQVLFQIFIHAYPSLFKFEEIKEVPKID